MKIGHCLVYIKNLYRIDGAKNNLKGLRLQIIVEKVILYLLERGYHADYSSSLLKKRFCKDRSLYSTNHTLISLTIARIQPDFDEMATVWWLR